MALLVPFLCTLLLIGVQAQSAFFNSSTNCTAGCYLNDPTIYNGYALPTPDQAVFFNVTDPDTLLIAPSNSTYNVTELHVFGRSASLIIEANATISVVDHVYLSNVILAINVGGSLVGQTVEDEEAETEAEFESSTIECYGFIGLYQASFFLSYVTGYNSSRFSFSEFELENGTIDVWEGAQFAVLDESDFSYSKLYYGDAPTLGEVDFETVDATFPNGFYAENQYVISSSNFTAYFPDALSNVSFILAGKNNLNVSNLNFNSDKIKINSTGTTPFITFNVNNNASFDGNLTVPGEVVVNSGSTVSFNGNISLSGGLTADVTSTTRIRATGALVVGAAISFVGHNANNSFIVQDANITAPSINLDTFELRSYTGTTTINGNLLNNGSLHIWESSSVIVQGNYTQHPNATFGVYNLNNDRDRLPNLVVGGSAQLDGEIRFNTSETKKKFTAIVLQAASSITGNFTTVQFYGDVNEYKPQVTIVDSAVIVSINPPSRLAWKGLDWWVWLLVGVGALTLLITLFVIIRVVRNRSRYEPVRGQY